MSCTRPVPVRDGDEGQAEAEEVEGVAWEGEGVVVLQHVEVLPRLPTQHIQDYTVPQRETYYSVEY